MKKTMKSIFFIFLLLFITQIQAQNKEIIDKILQQLNILQKEINTDLLITKTLPYEKDKIVLVIPKIDSEDEGEVEYSLIIIIANTNGDILNKYYDTNKLISNAVYIETIIIDTGLYRLNEETRAFGVRMLYSGSSRVFPYHFTNLSLYIPINSTLKKVVNELEISKGNGEFEMDCKGYYSQFDIFIDIDKIKTNGFYDLILNKKTTDKVTDLINGDCLEESDVSFEKMKLIYNGIEYK